MRCQVKHIVVRASVPRMHLPPMKWLNADCHEGKSGGRGLSCVSMPSMQSAILFYQFRLSVCPTVRLSVKCRYWSLNQQWQSAEGLVKELLTYLLKIYRLTELRGSYEFVSSNFYIGYLGCNSFLHYTFCINPLCAVLVQSLMIQPSRRDKAKLFLSRLLGYRTFTVLTQAVKGIEHV